MKIPNKYLIWIPLVGMVFAVKAQNADEMDDVRTPWLFFGSAFYHAICILIVISLFIN